MQESLLTRVLVIQSHQPDSLDIPWMRRCVDSVEQWAAAQGYDYQFYGDEAFDLLPPWYARKFATRGPILSDLARLKLITRSISQGYSLVIWADADLLIFDPTGMPKLEPDDCAFGVETWVDQAGSNRIRTWRNIHNAFTAFHRDSVVLPYLIYCVESIGQRIVAEAVAPQTFGPKLLTALNSIAGFDRIDAVGAFSSPVLANISAGAGPFLERLNENQPCRPVAANLCASLGLNNSIMSRVCERLLSDHEVIFRKKNGHPKTPDNT